MFTTTGVLNASGVATTAATFAPTSAGTYTWTATYAGSAANNPATHACNQPSETFLVRAPVSTTTAVSTSPNPSLVGEPFTITATVTSSDSSAGTPTGQVTFRDGTTVLGTAALNASGVATLSTALLASGVHQVVAVYAGDARHLGSQGSATHTVNRRVTELDARPAVLQRSPDGYVVVLSAVLTHNGAPVVGRTVRFLVNGELACSEVTDGQGLARCEKRSKAWSGPIGRYGYQAFFDGDSTYLPSADTAAMAPI